MNEHWTYFPFSFFYWLHWISTNPSFFHVWCLLHSDQWILVETSLLKKSYLTFLHTGPDVHSWIQCIVSVQRAGNFLFHYYNFFYNNFTSMNSFLKRFFLEVYATSRTPRSATTASLIASSSLSSPRPSTLSASLPRWLHRLWRGWCSGAAHHGTPTVPLLWPGPSQGIYTRGGGANQTQKPDKRYCREEIMFCKCLVNFEFILFLCFSITNLF
jgi:hypothetical protein